MVFHAGWPIRLVTLDVTNKTLLERKRVQALASNGNPITWLIQQMVENFLNTFGLPRGITAFQMHDPLCLSAALQPEIIIWEPAYVDVEIASSLTLGETVVYFSNLREDIDPSLEHLHSPHMLTSVGVDVERFIAMFVDRIQSTFGFDKPTEYEL